MEWAVTLRARSGPEGILMILPDRFQAQSIAEEIRAKGHDVVVQKLSSPRDTRRPMSSPPDAKSYSKTTVLRP